jgi:glycosyltransferase involved in cell wall biosynthesis
MNKIVAGIPALNAAETIVSVINRAKLFVDVVVVIDDGSKDETAIVSSQAGAIVIKHQKNIGYGAALSSAFKVAQEIGAEALVIIDSDGQHNPNEIPKVLKPIICAKADISIGSRFLTDFPNSVPVYRTIGIRILNLVTNVLGANVRDSQSGFRAYSKTAITSVKPSINGMGAGSEILIRAKYLGLQVVEVPINCIYDSNSSTQNPLRHGLSIVRSLMVYRLTNYKIEKMKIPSDILNHHDC